MVREVRIVMSGREFRRVHVIRQVVEGFCPDFTDLAAHHITCSMSAVGSLCR